MRIGVPRETVPGERRVALVPESCKTLLAKGLEVRVEAGAGEAAYFPDEAYRRVGVGLEADPEALLQEADLVLKVQPPTEAEASRLRPESCLLCPLLPSRRPELVRLLAARGVTALSTDLIPRITRAQAMDTLSAMASLAGYKAVLLAAAELPSCFPMFMTAAGTILPAKVFVIGAGVAGLQAVATARRLGAAVTATDTRKAAAEQVQSLGAKFVGVESVEDAQTASGYARELSQDFARRQAELIARQCAASDVVITTALIGGVSAPRLISAAMVGGMQPGSVIVDLAAEAGGNCELSRPGETVVAGGVKILAPLNLPASMPRDASRLFSRNLTAFVLAFWREAEGRLHLDPEDEIVRAALVTRAGAVVAAPARAAA